MTIDANIKNSYRETLKNILHISSPTGRERAMTDHIKSLLSPYSDDVFYDNYGNLIVKVGGSGKKLMLCAHTDELGYWVKSITDDGFLNVTKVGVPDKCIEARRVVVNGHIPGVVGMKSSHLQTPEEKLKLINQREIFIDIGVRSREKVEALGIKIGSYASPACDYMEMADPDLICCKALDDRAGCAVLMELLKNIDRSALICELYLVFTIQEEMGLRGATAAASLLEPDQMIALDTLPCADTPGMNWEDNVPAQLGHGVGCLISEGSSSMNFVHPIMEEKIFRLAGKYDIPIQPVSICGFSCSTDASGAVIHGKGMAGAVLNIPTRYSHSPVELMHIDDAMCMIELLLKFVTEE